MFLVKISLKKMQEICFLNLKHKLIYCSNVYTKASIKSHRKLSLKGSNFKLYILKKAFEIICLF